MKNLLEYFMERKGITNKNDVTLDEMEALSIAIDFMREFNNPKVRDIIQAEKIKN